MYVYKSDRPIPENNDTSVNRPRSVRRAAGIAALSAALLAMPLAPALAAGNIASRSSTAAMRVPAGPDTRGIVRGADAVVAQNGGAATESTSGNAGAGQNSGIATTNGSGVTNGGGGGGLWGLIGLIGLLGLLGLRRPAAARSAVVTTTSAPPR